MKIVFNHCSFQYQTLASSRTNVLRNISLELNSGEMVAVVGSTGSGKTTFLQQLNQLLNPTEGSIHIYDHDSNLEIVDVKQIRRKIGLVFQFPESQFFEETVYKEISFGLKQFKLSDSEVHERVYDVMNRVGLQPDVFASRIPFELSGGEKRRVAIACILILQPEFFVLDEPTAGLDASNVHRIETILKKIHQSGKTVIFVSHDMDLVARLAQRVLVFNNGEIIFDGSVPDLFDKEDLLNQANLDKPRVQQYLIELKAKGYPVHTQIFDFEEAKNHILQILQSNP